MPCGSLFHMITVVIVRVETDNLFHPDRHGYASLLHSFTVFLGQGNLPQPSDFILPLWAFPWEYISIALWTYYCGNSLVDLSSVSPFSALFLAGGSLNFSLFLKVLGPCSEDCCYGQALSSVMSIDKMLTWPGLLFRADNNLLKSLCWHQTPLRFLPQQSLCLHVYWASMWL